MNNQICEVNDTGTSDWTVRRILRKKRLHQTEHTVICFKFCRFCCQIFCCRLFVFFFFFLFFFIFFDVFKSFCIKLRHQTIWPTWLRPLYLLDDCLYTANKTPFVLITMRNNHDIEDNSDMQETLIGDILFTMLFTCLNSDCYWKNRYLLERWISNVLCAMSGNNLFINSITNR